MIYFKTAKDTEEEFAIAEYLVSKGYLCVVEKKESDEYSLTQEGKAYLSEYERGRSKELHHNGHCRGRTHCIYYINV